MGGDSECRDAYSRLYHCKSFFLLPPFHSSHSHGGLFSSHSRGGLFSQDFDTGSADFWIPGAAVGGDYTCFDTNASSTAVQSSKNFSILYGDGSTVKGPVYTDTVSIAGLSATKQSVAVISTMEADFFGSSLPVDGILGMCSRRPPLRHSSDRCLLDDT